MKSVAIVSCLLVSLLLPGAAAAQRAAAVVRPDTVRVGDVFEVAVAVEVPAGHRVVLPDTLEVAGDVENAGRRRMATAPLPDGGERVTARYPLAAWRPDEGIEIPVTVLIEGPDGGEERVIMARLPVVRSVLPPDTAGTEPRPPKDVLGPDRTILPLVLAALGFLAVAIALWWWWRRRRGAEATVALPSATPRERALALLEEARDLGLVERGAYKEFYTLVSGALRGYLAAVDPRWGEEWTTTELCERARDAMAPEALVGLAGILEAADLVKFAKRRPAPAEAYAEWEAAHAWLKAARWGEPAAGEGAEQQEADATDAAVVQEAVGGPEPAGEAGA